MASRPPISPLTIRAEHDHWRSVLRLQGELDICSAGQLRQALRSVLSRRPLLLVLDLSALRYTDCAGLSVMACAARSLAGRGGTVRITGAQPAVRRLMQLTGTGTGLAPEQPGQPEPPGTGSPVPGS